jgi:zinc transport system substrate-binding protein
MNGRSVIALLAAALAVAGCSGSESENRKQPEMSSRGHVKPTIYTVNYPLKYFADRIGGDAVTVHFPAPKDVDPAFWTPEAPIVAAYQRADLILLNGADYAKWTAKVSLPASKTLDTSAGFRDRLIRVTEAVTHSHGPQGEHAHTGTAFTTWLDFGQAASQAVAIRDALLERWPEENERWEKGYSDLADDLEALDAEFQNAVAGKQSRALFASHPVYQYLANRYALNIKSVMWEPDVFPSERQWRELAHLANDHDVAWMVWEGDPLTASVERLEEMGIRSVVFDPCGNVPDDGDFLSVMRENIERMKSVYH